MRGQPIVLDWLSLVWWPGLSDIPPPGVLRFPYFSGDWARPRISGFLHRVWTLCSPVFSSPRHQPSDGPVFGFASFCAAFRPLMASSSTTSTPIRTPLSNNSFMTYTTLILHRAMSIIRPTLIPNLEPMQFPSPGSLAQTDGFQPQERFCLYGN